MIHVLACNRIDKEKLITAYLMGGEECGIGFCREKHSQTFYFMQALFLVSQLQDLIRTSKCRKISAHQRLVGVDTAVRGGNNWLEVIRKQLFIQHFMEQAAHLGFLCVFCKKLQIEFGNVPFFCFLYLVHCEIRIFFQRRQICTVFRIPGNSAGKAKGQFTTTWQLQGCI